MEPLFGLYPSSNVDKGENRQGKHCEPYEHHPQRHNPEKPVLVEWLRHFEGSTRRCHQVHVIGSGSYHVFSKFKVLRYPDSLEQGVGCLQLGNVSLSREGPVGIQAFYEIVQGYCIGLVGKQIPQINPVPEIIPPVDFLVYRLNLDYERLHRNLFLAQHFNLNSHLLCGFPYIEGQVPGIQSWIFTAKSGGLYGYVRLRRKLELRGGNLDKPFKFRRRHNADIHRVVLEAPYLYVMVNEISLPYPVPYLSRGNNIVNSLYFLGLLYKWPYSWPNSRSYSRPLPRPDTHSRTCSRTCAYSWPNSRSYSRS